MSGVYQVLKHLRETGSALPTVGSTLSQGARTSNLIKKTPEKSEQIRKEALGNWLQRLMSVMTGRKLYRKLT